ncbi:MAG TPA: c-type cytochrome [Gammaproteobacteria bacterium]|nr:c-type cytochrome [Gammaproteobacteria bacterium]
MREIVRPVYAHPRCTGACRAAVLLAAAFCAAPLLVGAQDAPSPVAAWSRTKAADETRGSPTERGAAVFNNWCSACHSHGPANAPGTTSLQFKYQGKLPAALEDRKDLTVEQVKFYVRNGVATMPHFRKTEVGDADLDALAAYLTRRE